MTTLSVDEWMKAIADAEQSDPNAVTVPEAMLKWGVSDKVARRRMMDAEKRGDAERVMKRIEGRGLIMAWRPVQK